jgi:hypothetical protein
LHLDGVFNSNSNVGECDGAGGVARMERGGFHVGFLWGNLKERVKLEDLSIDESVILKLILSLSVGRRSGSG